MALLVGLTGTYLWQDPGWSICARRHLLTTSGPEFGVMCVWEWACGKVGCNCGGL